MKKPELRRTFQPNTSGRVRIRLFAFILALCLLIAALPALGIPVSAKTPGQVDAETLDAKLAVYAEYRNMLDEILNNMDTLFEITERKDYRSHAKEWEALRTDPEGDLAGLALDMVDTVVSELTDYYTGKTDSMPLEVANNELFHTLPLHEAGRVMGDPASAKTHREDVALYCEAAVDDVRAALRTGSPETAQKALSDYSEALQSASQYLNASGFEKAFDPSDSYGSVGDYLAHYRDPSEYESYDEDTAEAASGAMMEAFFAYTARVGFQVIADYREYLAFRPILSEEERDLLNLLNEYSLQSLFEAQTAICDELLPYFFFWQPDSTAGETVLSFPGGTWKIQGSPYEIRTGKYAELIKRVSVLSKKLDALTAAEEAIPGYDPDLLEDLERYQADVLDLLAELDLVAVAVADYYGGKTDVLGYTMDRVEDNVKYLSGAFGDPSQAARELDIIVDCCAESERNAREAVTTDDPPRIRRALEDYALEFETFARYFTSGGLIYAYECTPDLETAHSDTAAFADLDEDGIRNAWRNLGYYLDYFMWLKDFFKGADQRDYLVTLDELSSEQQAARYEAERFQFQYVKEYGDAVIKELLPQIFAPFFEGGADRVQLLLYPNKGTGSTRNMYLRRDVETQLPKNTFTREGYDFVGWNSQSDGTGYWSYSDGDSIRISSDGRGLYAQWKAYPPVLQWHPDAKTLEEKLAIYAEFREILEGLIENADTLMEIAIQKEYPADFRVWYMLRTASEGDYMALAVEMVDTVVKELSDYYTGKTDAMPLEIAKNEIYHQLPLWEATVTTGDPNAAKKDRETAALNATAAVEDAREAVRTGNPGTAQRALGEYAAALEAAADYLQASGLQKACAFAYSDPESLEAYLTFYSNSSEFENYDAGTTESAAATYLEAFFACTLRLGYQILADYQEYLEARPSLSDEEAELLELVRTYSFQPLAEAETVIREELLPYFFCWQPGDGAGETVLSFPGGTWQLEGTPYEIRTGKYAQLRTRVAALSERIDELAASEAAIPGYDPGLMDLLDELQEELEKLLADLDLAAPAVADYYSGKTDVLGYTMDFVEEYVRQLGSSFGDPSRAARDIDIIIAELNAASFNARNAVYQSDYFYLRRSTEDYSDAFKRLSDFFDANGIISAYSQISAHETDYADLSAVQNLDEAGIRTAAYDLADCVRYYKWLGDYFKAIDQRDYLVTLEELTREQQRAVNGVERYMFRYLPPCGIAILEESLPNFYVPFRMPGEKRAAVILDPNGGDGGAAALFIRQDSEAPLPANVLTREGYEFAGWDTKPDGTGDTSFEDKGIVRITSDLRLYAKWNPLPATAPALTGQPQDLSLTYGYTSGNTLSVTAVPADGHTVTGYQWYAGSSGDPDSQAIESANGASFTVPAGLEVGTYDYFCIVTATRTDNSETETATSETATVTVSKAVPDCAIPEGLKASYGQTLADVELPAGWTWDDPLATDLGNAGNRSFPATFTPADEKNYESVAKTLTIAVAKAVTEAAELPKEQLPVVSASLVEEAVGSPLVVVPSELPEGYERVLYSTDGGTKWSDQVPSYTTPGEYSVLIKYKGDANHEDLLIGPFAVSVVKAVYAFEFEDGDTLDYIKRSSPNLTVTVGLTGIEDTSFEHFVGVSIGETELVYGTDYTVTKGSTVVTILPAALENLRTGTHILTIRFTNGEVSTYFTVYPVYADTLSAPLTGDNNHIEIWIALMTVSAVTMLVLLLTLKKKKSVR